MPSPANWQEAACGGVSEDEWKAMVAKGPYITADQLQDPIGNFVATAESMDGIWETKPFHVGVRVRVIMDGIWQTKPFHVGVRD